MTVSVTVHLFLRTEKKTERKVTIPSMDRFFFSVVHTKKGNSIVNTIVLKYLFNEDGLTN